MAIKNYSKGLYNLLFIIGFLAVCGNNGDTDSISCILLTKFVAALAFLGMYLINRNLSAQNPS